jgi:hypothetical protein
MVSGDLADERDVLPNQADESPPDETLLYQPRRNPARRVAGDGEADTLGRLDDKGKPSGKAKDVMDNFCGAERLWRLLGSAAIP